MIRTTLAAAGLALAVAPALAEPAKLPAPVISEDLSLSRQDVPVLDSTMTFIESGTGAPVLFLHGNPTSAYLWRNVIPHVAAGRRAIAVDLIGMGGSGKPDIAYTFADHARYLEAFVEALGLQRLTLVGHDWGAALAWDFAERHPDRVTGLAFMEGVLPPAFPLPSYDAMGPAADALRALRDPEQGATLVYEQNMFVEQMLPGFVNRPLGEAAMTAYRAPFLNAADRLPTLQWPRELPIEGVPARNVAVMERIAAFMATASMPTLLLYAEPGVATPSASVDWYRATVPGIETAYVGQGLHFIQEDHPRAIGLEIADWLRRTQ